MPDQRKRGAAHKPVLNRTDTSADGGCDWTGYLKLMVRISEGFVLVVIGKFVPYHSATLNIAVRCCTQSRRREKGEEQTDRSSLCLRWAVEERERRGLESCEAGANLQGESHSLCRRIEQARQGCRCEAVATSRRGKTQVVKAFFRQGVAVVDRWRNVTTDWFTLYELKPYTFSTGEFIHAVVYLNTAYRWYCRGR